MKNSITYIFFFLFLFLSKAYSQELSINFNTKTLNISENGNLVEAYSGKVISSDKEYTIDADYYLYNRNNKILKINGNGLIYLKSNDIEIRFNKAILNETKSTIEANENVKVKFLKENLNINSNKIIYDFKNEILNVPNKAITQYDSNKIYSENLIYELKNNLLKIKDLSFFDKEKNNIKSKIAFINTEKNSLYGKDIFLRLDNKTFNENSEPRLSGNSLKINGDLVEITKGVFTSCKRRDDCPPWELKADKIIHDKKKKIIQYENGFFRFYDKPILYFPKFYHPDPSVKRRSGFLSPSFKNSTNQKNYITIPYYLVVAENKDFTFSPRIYDHEELLIQTEYRQVGYNSNHISDFSFKINDDKKLKSHFFYDYQKSFNTESFINNDFYFKLQSTTKDTYIKKNNIKSELIKNEDILENSVKFNFLNEDTSLQIETVTYENLNKNETDRFEYIIPKLNLTRKINTQKSLNGNLQFSSTTFARNYETNIFEKVNINDILYDSFPYISRNGFYSNFQLLLKNVNTDAKKSKYYKNKENFDVSSLLQFNTNLPLLKENELYKKITTPKISFKISPNNTKDIKNDDIKIDTNNIFSLNRYTKQDMVEGGLSMAYGNSYSIFNKSDNSRIINFEIANNLRLKENSNLPSNSQIGQKTSSILSKINYTPNKNISFDYSTSIKNNLKDINYENLITELYLNNIKTSFEYSNQNNSLYDRSFLSNKTKLFINNSNSLLFSTRRNNILNLTEYYNLAYEYKNDCLTASIEYDKNYYQDKDLKPNESISFKLTIIPFNSASK